MFNVMQKLCAEALGTAMLVAIVVGSGIMGVTLSGGNAAMALLANSVATGAGLVVLITIFGPVSGAHFNPFVSLAFVLRREMGVRLGLAFMVMQTGGAVGGVLIAHEMFGQALIQVSTHARDGLPLVVSEAIATFGLIATIFGCVTFKPDFTPMGVGLYITAAYWFTASTAFANPAVTIARSLTRSFAGIAPHSVPQFIVAQLIGAMSGAVLMGWLFNPPAKETSR